MMKVVSSGMARSTLNLAVYLPLAVLLFCSGFLKVTAQASPVDQDSECDAALKACLYNHVTRLSNSNDQEAICGVVNDFASCINRLACLSDAEKRTTIDAVVNDFAKLNVHCEVTPQSPDSTSTVDHTPTEGDASQGSQSECSRERDQCSLQYVDATFKAEVQANGQDMKAWFCPQRLDANGLDGVRTQYRSSDSSADGAHALLNQFVDCLLEAPCDDDTDTENIIRKEIDVAMKKTGISCDILMFSPDETTTPESESTTGGQTSPQEGGSSTDSEGAMDGMKDGDGKGEQMGGETKEVVEGGDQGPGQTDDENGDGDDMGDEGDELSDNDSEEEPYSEPTGEPKGEPTGDSEEENEQAGASYSDPRDSAPSSLSGIPCLTILLSLCVIVLSTRVCH